MKLLIGADKNEQPFSPSKRINEYESKLMNPYLSYGKRQSATYCPLTVHHPAFHY